jgi:hypothetical protein
MLTINQMFRLFVILFLSFFSFAQKENSGNLFEVSVNGTKWLFGTSLNNFSEQNNDLSFIEKELISLEEISNNFRVPTFAEIELMLTQKIALPDYNEKVECAKMCYCSGEKEGSYWFPDNVGCSSYGHYCKKCSSWTNDQRRYNVCPTCNGNQRTYCGKSYTCTKCKGKGFYLEIRTPSPLNMSEFLSKKNIILREYYLFYDNPMEYGLFWNDVKNSKTHKINARIYECKEKLALAGGIVLINGSKRIEKEITILKTQDAERSKNIYDLIASQKLEKAAYEYMNLKYANSDLRAKIQSELDKANSNPLNLTDEEIKRFVSENKNTLNSLNSGKYSVKIDGTRKVSFNEIDYSKSIQVPNIFPISKYVGNFEVSLNYAFTLNIIDSLSDPTKEELDENKDSRINWQVNPDYKNLNLIRKVKPDRTKLGEQINWVGNDKYFYTTNSSLIGWLGKKYYEINNDGKFEKITYSKEVPLNQIKCSFMKKKVRYVNGNETNNQMGYFKWQEFELNRMRWVHRTKLISVYFGYGGLFGGLFWWGVRAAEWSSANDGTYYSN